MSEKVSIIITCYNYAQYLPEAIDSALSQTYPSVEVILVNDGSTDDTDKVAKSYGKQIQYLRQDNHGVVAARNNGAALAKGKYVCFLDADDKLHPNFVQALVRGFDADGGIQLAYCDYELIGESGKQWKSGPWNVYRLIFDNYLMPA